MSARRDRLLQGGQSVPAPEARPQTGELACLPCCCSAQWSLQPSGDRRGREDRGTERRRRDEEENEETYSRQVDGISFEQWAPSSARAGCSRLLVEESRG
jgi:hypothetical protein